MQFLLYRCQTKSCFTKLEMLPVKTFMRCRNAQHCLRQFHKHAVEGYSDSGSLQHWESKCVPKVLLWNIPIKCTGRVVVINKSVDRWIVWKLHQFDPDANNPTRDPDIVLMWFQTVEPLVVIWNDFLVASNRNGSIGFGNIASRDKDQLPCTPFLFSVFAFFVTKWL